MGWGVRRGGALVASQLLRHAADRARALEHPEGAAEVHGGDAVAPAGPWRRRRRPRGQGRRRPR
eukprot:1545540-Lingulodinium_polyedra.AAC.1